MFLYHAILCSALLMTWPLQALSQGGEADNCTCDGEYCQARAADVIIVLDESPSMYALRLWMAYTVQQLDFELIRHKGLGADRDCPNRFAIFGFGRSTTCISPVQSSGSSEVFVTMEEMLSAFDIVSPPDSVHCEDGYSALGQAFGVARRSSSNQCVKTLTMLVTDEDRDRNCGCNPSFKKTDIIRNYLVGSGIELAVVVDQTVESAGGECLGMNSAGQCFMPDLATYHDFTTVTQAQLGGGHGKTRRHYSNMALARKVNGSVWDIKKAHGDLNWHISRALRADLVNRVPACGAPPPPTTLPPPTTAPPPTTTLPPTTTAPTTEPETTMLLPTPDPPTVQPPTQAPTTQPPTEPPTIACPTVEDPMNGNLVLGVVNDRLVYQTQCDAGYLVNGGLSGIFECQPDGTFSSAIPTCVDIDECTEIGDSCIAPAFCVNTPGAFRCDCPAGYQSAGSDRCENINECVVTPGICDASAACVDTEGSYSCTCDAGYSLVNGACANIDECQDSPCHAGASCKDTMGSFECQCRDGLVGDGISNCVAGCIGRDGNQIAIGQSTAVHWTAPAVSSSQSACVVFALTEASSGGLPNGFAWIPTGNISHRLEARARRQGFSNVEFCIILGGQSAAGRTVQVGATTACGTAAELTRVVQTLRDTESNQDLATTLLTQLQAKSTCAGQDGYVTSVITMLSIDAISSTPLTNGLLARTIGNANGMLLLLGELEADNVNAQEYVVGYDYRGRGYEPGIDTGRLVILDDGMTEILNDKQSFLSYTNLALLTGGAVFDSSWLTGEELDYLPQVEEAVLMTFADNMAELLRSHCALCRCVSAGQLDCGQENNVIRSQLCTALHATV